jgi:Fe-S cluster assembly protein SufD
MIISFQKENTSELMTSLTERIARSTSKKLRDYRTQAAEDYQLQKQPNRKVEHWKYNDMSFLTHSKFAFVDSPLNQYGSKLIESNQSSLFELDDASILFIVDGAFAPSLSNINNENVTVTLFENTDESQQELIEKNMASAKQAKNALLQFNSAISENGLLVEINKNNEVEKPLYIVYLATDNSERSADDKSPVNRLISSNIVIQCEPGSNSQVIEHFITTAPNEKNLVLQQSIVNLQQDASCQHYRINSGSASSRQVSRVLMMLHANAKLSSFYFSQGEALSKTDIDVQHLGQNSESQLTGIYLPSGENTVDYHTNIEHQVAHCESREIFRGIIADAAKATFNGKIHIFRDAQKSDAELSNKNLLLTNRAEINTKPELEIYADDVVCAHGATIAKIDEQAIYYLQTRGIDQQKAKKMLSVGFIVELLDKVHNNALHEQLNQLIHDCLSSIN